MWEFMNGNGWWFGTIHMALFWGVTILVIIALARIIFGPRTDEQARQPSPVFALIMDLFLLPPLIMSIDKDAHCTCATCRCEEPATA